MSEARYMLSDTANRLFAELIETPFDEASREIASAGLQTLLVPEVEGGFGGDWEDAFAIFHLAGLHRLTVPLGEDILARHLLSVHGLPVPPGQGSIADHVVGEPENGHFTGDMPRVPWGGDSDWVVAASADSVFVVSVQQAAVARRHNLAGEPRDDLTFTCVGVEAAPSQTSVRPLGAMLRACQTVGALEASLALAIEHVNSRQQFGKPLARQQAIQQSLAVAAMEIAASRTAAEAAAHSLDRRDDASLEIGAAKLRTNQAVGQAAPLLHQAHGAIGFTAEYPLQHFTRRAHAWRGEFGSDRYWAQELGRIACATGPGFWHDLVQRSDV